MMERPESPELNSDQGLPRYLIRSPSVGYRMANG